MSLENHPNFDAVKFAVEVMKAYRNSLRGPGINCATLTNISDMTTEFTEKIEEEVDKECERKKRL